VDNGRADRGAMAAVARINVLDDFLAPLVLEIDVDIGRLAAVRRNEAGEQKFALVRINLGDAEAKADRAVCRRAAALAQNLFFVPCIGDHVVHGEKVMGVFEIFDQRQFVVQPLDDVWRNAVWKMLLGIAFRRARPGQVRKMLLGGLARRHRFVGIFVFQISKREVAGFGDLDRVLDCFRKSFEQPGHFLGRLDVALGIDGEPEARFGQRAFFAHAGEHVGERPALRRMIEHVIDGDERRADAFAKFGQQAKPARLIAAMIMHAGKKSAPRR
jgi:hypothetical protein